MLELSGGGGGGGGEILLTELPTYLAVASSQTEPIAWWKSHEADFQNWTKALRLVLLVQPSLAAAERVYQTHFLHSRSHHLKTIFNCL